MSQKLTRELSIPAADTKRIIDCAWFELTSSLQGNFTYELQSALDIEMKDERAHRNRGKGFSTRDWRPAYKVSVEHTAKLFILQWLYKAPHSVELESLRGLRDAVVKTWSLASRMRRTESRRADAENACTLYERFRTRITESRYVYGKPILRGGVVDQIPAKQKNLLAIFIARCDYAALYDDTENESLQSPLFMLIAYSKDIANNG